MRTWPGAGNGGTDCVQSSRACHLISKSIDQHHDHTRLMSDLCQVHVSRTPGCLSGFFASTTGTLFP